MRNALLVGLVLMLAGCAVNHGIDQADEGALVVREAKESYEAWRRAPDDGKLRRGHDLALERVVGWLSDLPAGGRFSTCASHGLVLDIEGDGHLRWEEFVPARKLDCEVLDQRHERMGVGVPVVAVRKNDGAQPLDRLRPPEGIATSFTAVLMRSGGGWKLKLLDPTEHETTRLEDKWMPLAADFTAPIAIVVKRAGALRKSGRSGMLKPGQSERKEKLYLIDPYDPKRIPLVMVHGLQSTPVTFGNLTNDVFADPELHRRYQVWHYHYPTGLPVLQNAATYRRILDETLKELDPEGDDFATNHLVVIGHSMGGVMTHTLTCDSDYVLWDKVITARPAKFECQPEFRKRLEPLFLFERDRRVKRVIFISVPHRGSLYADNWIGDLGQQLFRGDAEFHSVFNELVKHHRDEINPFLLALVEAGKLSSIRTLSPNSPALRALAEIPPQVPFHNIMGQKREGPKELGSDGIVAYESSRMDGAESELIVRSGHNAFRNPEAVKEIKRILRLHLALKKGEE